MYLIPILNVTVRSKVNYAMNAIWEPPEPMGGDIEHWKQILPVENDEYC